MTEAETSLLAHQLRRDEDARRILEREPSRFWPSVLASIPLLCQAVLPNQMAAWFGLPPAATWFIAFTVTFIIYLSGEVNILRRQVKALHHLHLSKP